MGYTREWGLENENQGPESHPPDPAAERLRRHTRTTASPPSPF
jgi:hypothetical protein